MILRRLTPVDAAALFSYRSLPKVFRYQSFRPETIADADAFLAGTAAEANVPETWYQLGIFLKDTPALIGDIGIHFLPDGEIELGCTLAPESQGQGFATEAVSAVIGYLFEVMDKRRIVFSIDPRNSQSRNLAARMGMRQIGLFEKSVLIGSEWCDDAVYAIGAEDWAGRRPRIDPGRD